MRPQILFPLFASVRTLPGVGPKLAAAVEKVAGPRVVDLLWHLPAGLIDRRYAPTLAAAEPGRVATVTVRVDRHQPSAGRQPYRVQCSDRTGRLTLVFFHAHAEYLEKVLPWGSERVVSGLIERYGDRLQMTHPDHVVEPAHRARVLAVEPVYGLTAGITAKQLARIVEAAVDRAPELAEWLDPAFASQRRWPAWRAAVGAAHAPQAEAALSPVATERIRLAYDELLANQLALALMRARLRRAAGRSVRGDGHLVGTALAALGFSLTRSQERVLAEIRADMAGDTRMLRLLQGDVGSGKTVVAVLAMLTAVEAGAQAALMAPTEILARQHLATIAPVAQAAGVPVALLTGRDKGKARDTLLAGLADGSLPLVVGTHSLFQGTVGFCDLALTVIDEQHRFGVHQRLDLAAKGRAVDVLVMTATPIPRTLMLTAYGDMEVSKITEKPPGRRPVDTRAVSLDRLDEVVAAVGRGLAAGAKAFWICPLVEESDTLDVAAAESRHRHLSGLFGTRVGLVHGRMKGTDKDAVMAAFANAGAGPGTGAGTGAGTRTGTGTDTGIDLLVATTVVEVGVDVPAATVMVIEHAERFGLAQLHQLRGRIGRGRRPSTCLLLYAPPLGEAARARLSIMRESEDGFRIAEEDLKLRGAGELLGTRQSGMPSFRLADLGHHADLLLAARDDVRLILQQDPELTTPRGQALRTLLYLFERDAAVRYLRSG